MRDWITGIVGEDMATGAMLVVVTVAIVLAFLVLFAIFKGFSGTGIRNNRRTRQARLAVMDAAIVDSRRRLVLVRRDDIEHLILIGGPTDVVVEQNINRSATAAPAKSPISRAQKAPAAKSAPVAPEQTPVAVRPVPAAATRAPASSPSVNASVEKPIPVPSPQIRPATKPPAPMASSSSVDSRTPIAPSNPVDSPSAVPAVAASSVPLPAQATTPPVTMPPATTKRGGRSSPVLAQASASTAALAAATPIAAMATPVESQSASVENDPSEPAHAAAISSTTVPAANDIAEDQLADFEDNLAMNLGETLVTENASADKSELANEMDELLNEITLGGKR